MPKKGKSTRTEHDRGDGGRGVGRAADEEEHVGQRGLLSHQSLRLGVALLDFRNGLKYKNYYQNIIIRLQTDRENAKRKREKGTSKAKEKKREAPPIKS